MRAGKQATAVETQLAALASARGITLREIANQFVCERMLAALGAKASHENGLVLHGAWALGLWFRGMPRSTEGLDLLDLSRRDETALIETLRSSLSSATATDVKPDWGCVRITSFRSRPNPLFRLQILMRVGAYGVPLRINVTHAKCTPVQSELLMPSRALLGRSRSRVHCYTPEEMVAEKAALLVTYGPDYTRLIDYLDLGTLAERLSFEGDLLLEAMRGTFRHRDAERMLQRMDGYWEAALDARRLRGSAEQRWAHMIDQIRPTSRPDRLRNVILKVSEFLAPVLLALRNGTEAPECWRPDSGWNRATTVQETARGQSTLPFTIAA